MKPSLRWYIGTHGHETSRAYEKQSRDFYDINEIVSYKACNDKN